jgi:hypothetical protein
VYLDDFDVPWALRVDAEYVSDPARGWSVDDLSGLPPLPRMWRPRAVVGVDESGRTQRAIVGHTAAPLWTGTETTFVVEATDGSTVPVEVTRREQERRISPG